jgi:hypothetical protein
VKEEEEEYVLPSHDLGEVKEEDVEKDYQNHLHQSMGYWMNEPYWNKSCANHREPSSLLVSWQLR